MAKILDGFKFWEVIEADKENKALYCVVVDTGILRFGEKVALCVMSSPTSLF